MTLSLTVHDLYTIYTNIKVSLLLVLAVINKGTYNKVANLNTGT